MPNKISIIGGGAAGFFAAITAKETYPETEVVIFEKSDKLLAKVKVSGGGRCNVTNACERIKGLLTAYPRGGKHLRKVFEQFDNHDAMQWFEERGVPLKIENHGHVFPVSDSSQTIIDCLICEAQKLGVQIKTQHGVDKLTDIDTRPTLYFKNGSTYITDKVIIATGGSPKLSGLQWLADLGHPIVPPVPSLFTFNMPKNPITELMGVVAPHVLVKIQGEKLENEGPLLVTHWGMSGPAILKLSAFGARVLAEKNYQFNVQVNWTGEENHEVVREALVEATKQHPKSKLVNHKPFDIPMRLWMFILEKIELSPQKPWGELGKKQLNKFTDVLTRDVYAVSGKTTFKEEFVTCGGVSLEAIDLHAMRSNICSNIYFAGEVLDIDAITGGYNFQAAWSTGFVAGKLQ